MTYYPTSRTQAVLYAGLPAKTGLYDPANEHDSCGVGFVDEVHEQVVGLVPVDPVAQTAALQHFLGQMPDRFRRMFQYGAAIEFQQILVR